MITASCQDSGLTGPQFFARPRRSDHRITIFFAIRFWPIADTPHRRFSVRYWGGKAAMPLPTANFRCCPKADFGPFGNTGEGSTDRLPQPGGGQGVGAVSF